MIEVALVLAGWILLIAFLIWLLRYCLRVGAVGSFWQGDATRNEQPFRFWSGIIGLGAAAGMTVWIFVYAIWKMLLR